MSQKQSQRKMEDKESWVSSNDLKFKFSQVRAVLIFFSRD